MLHVGENSKQFQISQQRQSGNKIPPKLKGGVWGAT